MTRTSNFRIFRNAARYKFPTAVASMSPISSERIRISSIISDAVIRELIWAWRNTVSLANDLSVKICKACFSKSKTFEFKETISRFFATIIFFKDSSSVTWIFFKSSWIANSRSTELWINFVETILNTVELGLLLASKELKNFGSTSFTKSGYWSHNWIIRPIPFSLLLIEDDIWSSIKSKFLIKTSKMTLWLHIAAIDLRSIFDQTRLSAITSENPASANARIRSTWISHSIPNCPNQRINETASSFLKFLESNSARVAALNRLPKRTSRHCFAAILIDALVVTLCGLLFSRVCSIAMRLCTNSLDLSLRTRMAIHLIWEAYTFQLTKLTFLSSFKLTIAPSESEGIGPTDWTIPRSSFLPLTA